MKNLCECILAQSETKTTLCTSRYIDVPFRSTLTHGRPNQAERSFNGCFGWRGKKNQFVWSSLLLLFFICRCRYCSLYMICNEKCNIILNVFTLWNIFFQAAVYFCNTLRAINDIGFFCLVLFLIGKHTKKKEDTCFTEDSDTILQCAKCGEQKSINVSFQLPIECQ